MPKPQLQPRPSSQRGHRQESELRSEIAYLESRLLEMGAQGDCAYERALAKTFDDMLRERRHALEWLLAGHNE